MDEVWRSAPAAALCIWLDAGGPQVQENCAAARWAAAQGLTAADWLPLAAAHLQPGAPPDIAMALGRGGRWVGCRRLPLPQAGAAVQRWLLWLDLAAGAPEHQAALADKAAAGARRTAEFLDRALSLADVCVWRLDLRTERIHFNAVGFAQQGLAQDPAGMPIAELRARIHPDDRQAVLDAADEALRGQRVVDVTARYRRADGWHTLLTRRVADRDAAGHVTGLAGVALDLTAQAEERERADALAERSRLVADGIGVGFWTRDLSAGTAHWDAQMYRIHGRAPEAGPPGFSEWIDLYVHPQDQAWMRQIQTQATARWEPVVDTVFRAVDVDGQERWVQTWTRRLLRGSHRVAFGMHLDVSERQRARAVMERERSRAQFAIEAANIGVWERRLDGTVGYWSPAMYRLRGLEPDDPRSAEQLAVHCAHPDDLPVLNAHVAAHLRTGAPYRIEFRVRWPDGSWRWLATQGRAILGSDGGVLGMAGINIDITERKQADALRLQKDGAERASREKSAFLARVSHELRTPMNAVLGFSQLLLDDTADAPTPRQRTRLLRIGEAGGRMMALVDDLLELAHLDSGASAEAPQTVMVADILREVLAALALPAQQRGVALRHALPDAPLALYTARSRLQQLLLQLAGHALRQQYRGGWVELGCALEPPGDGGATAAAHAVFSVRDNGPGHDEAGLAALFEPFVRTGHGGGSAEGTGIALSLAQSLALALGSSIQVQSRPGSGTDFSLRLLAGPEPEPAPAAAGQRRPPPLATSPALHVLCVEDNPVNLLLVRELLALRPGVLLREATDGRSGLALALAQRPDVVLLDLQLPDISGLEVLAALRRQPAMDGCVYVALSADAMPDHISAARAAGFDDYWTKPIDFDSFLAGIDRLAGARS